MYNAYAAGVKPILHCQKCDYEPNNAVRRGQIDEQRENLALVVGKYLNTLKLGPKIGTIALNSNEPKKHFLRTVSDVWSFAY